ncbi:hypothetical protein [Niallia endozanthoxylica]|uniref:Uncharacterized protein n=1 Tax=Niallia endozanthoxylica TaxID=2036016 RepID=A0A5J5HPA8_9BACI|nr:hypothetical protein [Niallia endozanthoxylica]KAA9023564.1 hypothetical protein F4V44_12925 [Niallia endozanthoxylica]
MSKLNLNIDYEPNKGTVLNIRLNEIQYTEFQENKDTYCFYYESSKIKINLTFLNEAFKLINNKRPLEKKNISLKRHPVTIRKHKKGYIDFIYQLDQVSLKKYRSNNGPFTIILDKKLFKIQIILKKHTKQSINALFNKHKQRRSIEVWDKRTIVRISSEVKPDRFDSEIRDEEQNNIKSTYINNKFEYEKYGIYLTYPNSFRRCNNCVNYNNNSCIAHRKVEVSENHTCKRFYQYRTYLGGGFSPR